MIASGRRMAPCTVAGVLAALVLGCRAAPPPAAPAAPVAPQEPSKQLLGHCGLAEGDAQIRRGDAAWAQMAVGEELWTDDRVKTGRLANARLDFERGGGVRLNDTAAVALATAPAPGVERALPVVVLESGALRAFVEPAAPGFYVEGPGKARVLVRGRGESPAQLRAEVVEGSLRTIAEVVEGSLEIAAMGGELALRAGGNESVLKVGQYVSLKAGELGEALLLPPAPEVIAPGPDARFFGLGLVVRLEWKPIAGARAYQVQVARDANFGSILWSAEADATHTVFAPRQPGRYLWRVAARDAAGRLGVTSEPRVLFCEPTPPEDFLAQPEDGARFRYYTTPPKVELGWRAVPGARSYRVLIARGDDLHADVAVNEVTAETRFERELAAGEYVWGVYSEDAVPQPAFLAPRHLRVEQSTVKTPSTLEHWGR